MMADSGGYCAAHITVENSWRRWDVHRPSETSYRRSFDVIYLSTGSQRLERGNVTGFAKGYDKRP